MTGWTWQAGRALAELEGGLGEAAGALRAAARADWVSLAAEAYVAEVLAEARAIDALAARTVAARDAVLVHTRAADVAAAVGACR